MTGAGAPDGVAAARAATGLESGRLTVQVVKGTEVRATARYRSPTDVPIVGRFIGDVTVERAPSCGQSHDRATQARPPEARRRPR